MGANFMFGRLPIDKEVAKVEFEEWQERDVYDNGHSYSGGWGMARGFAIKPQTFQTEAEAENWLLENAKKWEEALAVRVEQPKPFLAVGAWCSS